MDIPKADSAYQGIDEPTERLISSFSIPMDCYFLTSLIAIHFDKAKFYSFFFRKHSDKYDPKKLLNFLLMTPLVILIILSGVIVLSLQLYILAAFVDYEMEQTAEEDINYYLLRVILVVIFSMIIVPDYQTAVKKIVIGFQMVKPFHRAITVTLSSIQAFVTVIVLSATILLVRLTTNMDDLLQNFMAVYIIIQINDIMFRFMCFSNILNVLKVLGFKRSKIQHFKNIRNLLSRKKTLIEKQEKKIRILVDQVVFYGQIFFWLLTVTLTGVIFTFDLTTLGTG